MCQGPPTVVPVTGYIVPMIFEQTRQLDKITCAARCSKIT
jgi:hypothetical protein